MMTTLTKSSASVLLVLASAGVLRAQDTPKAITEVSRDGLRRVVLVEARDEKGAVRLGSGFVVSNDGKVVTNHHVIAGAQQALIKFADGTFYEVEGALAIAVEKDVAVLRLATSRSDFLFFKLGNSDHVQVGEEVIAIGSPLALEGTVSTGIVSAIRDSKELGMKHSGDVRLLQITAPISPGSSGGALLNQSGEVIGITFLQSLYGQNLNFAIPINYVIPLLFGSQTQPLSSIASIRDSSTQPSRRSIAGTYTGVWASDVFAVSGAAAVTVTVEENARMRAEIFLTGGQVKKDTLIGAVTEVGDGVWVAELKAEKANLRVKLIFKEGMATGDYAYRRFLARDRGRWILTKQVER